MTKAFWTAAIERAVKTFAQSLAVTLGAGVVNVLTVPWGAAFAVAAGAAIVSLLTSVVSAGSANAGPALFGPETVEAVAE